MANANISAIVLTNTFDEWRVATNDLITDRNILRNASYVKDNGSFAISNGTLTLAKTGGGTLLTVANDASFGGTITANNLVITSAFTISTLNVTTTINSPSYVTSTGLNVTNQANTARDQANSAYGQANSAYGQANSAYAQANAAYTQANSARSQANTAYAQANAAYDAANNASMKVTANSGTAISAGNLSFNNTSTITVSVTQNGANANVSLTAVGAGPNIWTHRTSTYNSANVYVSATAPSSGNLKGDIWLQI